MTVVRLEPHPDPEDDQKDGVWWRTEWMRMIWADRDPSLSGGIVKAVASFYADQAGRRTTLALSHARVADHVGVSERAVKAAVAKLRAAGYLVPVEERHRQSTVYRLGVPLGPK